MKVLFLLGMYYPRYSANGLCCKNVIDACVEKGWEVSCIVNSYMGDFNPYELDGAKIYPIQTRLTYRISEWCETHQSSKTCTLFQTIGKVLSKLKLALFSFSWPYVSPLYTQAFFQKAKALHTIEKYDVVVTAYTPIDSLYAGYKLKKAFPAIKMVPYYLDALAGGWGPVRWSPEKRDRRLRKWEKRIAERADMLISMESSRVYHENNPISESINNKRVYLDVPMMLPTIVSDRPIEKDRKYALFAGNIPYPRRNPIPLLELFVDICNELNIELLFAGTCNDYSIFEPYIKASNGRIRTLGQKSHEEILELEKNASYLVNIGSENPYTIPGKIFEYMRFKKPIISTYSIDNEPSIEYLKKYGAAFFVDERKISKGSIDSLKSFIESNEVVNISDEYCQHTFYKNTPQAFIDTLEKVLEVQR